MSNVDGTSTTLRIDSVKASKLKGTALNVARINTQVESAWKGSKFTEIALKVTPTERHHIFASMAYQSFPVEANYLSLS